MARREGRDFWPAEREISCFQEITRFHATLPGRLPLWVEHPDERVPIELLGRRASSVDTREEAQEPLCRRALREAEAEGALWTPLLDALVAENVWRSNATGHAGIQAERGLPDRDALLDRVVPWIEQCQEPQALHLLALGFRSTELRHCVARHGRCLTPELVESLLGSPEIGMPLAENPDLGAELAQAVHARVAREVRMGWGLAPKYLPVAIALEKAGHPVPPEILREMGEMLERLPGREGGEDHLLQHVELAQQYLAERQGLSAVELTRLFAAFLSGEARPALLKETLLTLIAHPAWGEEHEDILFQGAVEQETVSFAVLGSPGSTPRLLRRTYPVFKHFSPSVIEMCSHPKADADLLLWVAENHGHPTVREHLARTPEAIQDPRVRRALLGSSSLLVLKALSRAVLREENASEEEFREMYRRLVRRSPEEALRLLEEAGPTPRFTLASSDWLPLFQAKQAEVRERVPGVFALWREPRLAAPEPALSHAAPPCVRSKSR